MPLRYKLFFISTRIFSEKTLYVIVLLTGRQRICYLASLSKVTTEQGLAKTINFSGGYKGEDVVEIHDRSRPECKWHTEEGELYTIIEKTDLRGNCNKNNDNIQMS